MASKYDSLDAVRGLEQKVYEDLVRAFEPRGCAVVHHGSTVSHAPGGKPDLEIRDKANRRLILVEVTKRKGAAADGEFLAVAAHLESAIKAGGYKDYCCLFVSPATSARMSASIRNRHNRLAAQEGRPGRVIPIDFSGLDMLLTTLAESDPQLYPASRMGALFAAWDEALDDVRTRRLMADAIFSEDRALAETITAEMRKRDAAREQRLKTAIERLENLLRDYGVTGNAANATLIHLTFLRLYEEKREAEGGEPNRFTDAGFVEWSAKLPVQLKTANRDRLVEVLLREVAEDTELRNAGLLQTPSGQKERLHAKVTDTLVRDQVLPVFDEYQFYGSSVDVLGVVFETLARRGEKDTRVGQFFTPQEVVNFCTDIVDVGPRDVVLDPAVGTARFLIAAMNRMMARADEVAGARAKTEKTIKTRQLLGVDLDQWVATIAKMNMYIHGDGKSNVADANGLILGDRHVFGPYDAGLSGQVDVVLTNPPLGYTSFKVALQHWIAAGDGTSANDAAQIDFLSRLGTVPLRQSSAKHATQPPRLVPVGEKLKGGALFLGAIADYLKPIRHPNVPIEWQGGRAAIVVDEAILNTADYAETREFLRRHYFIKAVVSLGRQAFQYLAHTDAKTSILFLIRKPLNDVVQREPIFYAHAERVGYSVTGKWIGSDLPGVRDDVAAVHRVIHAQYRGAQFDARGCRSALAALDGYHDRWHTRFDEGKGDARLDYFYARFQDLSEVLHASGRPVVTLGDLIEPRTPLDNPEPSITGEYDFAVTERVGIVNRKGVQEVRYSPKDLWCVEEHDIVISGIDVIHGAAAVAGADVAGLVMSKEMFAYRVKPGVDVLPKYVALMLRTRPVRDMILGLVSGTSGRTRVTDPQQILSVPVLKPPSRREQDAAVAIGDQAAEYRRQADERLAQATELVAASWPTK